MDDDTSWLRLRRITCPGCQRIWHRVDRSPMADDWRQYCNQCGNGVEVSYFDPRVMDELRSSGQSPLDLMRMIVARLRPCDKGAYTEY